LTDVSVQYKNGSFVGAAVFPEIPVVKGSDKFTVYEKGNMFITEDDTIGKTGDASVIMGGSDTDTYSVQDHALKGFVTEEDRDNADVPLNPEIDITEQLTGAILLNREVRIHTAISGISQTTSPGTKWATSTGTPVTDIEAACVACFQRPNVCIISKPVWDKMKYNAELLGTIGGGFAGLKMARIDQIKELFGFDTVLIADARKNTVRAKNATTSATLSYIWGKDVFVGYVDPRATLKSCTFGKLMAQRLGGTGGPTFRVRKWNEPGKGVGGRDWIQVEHRSIEKIVCADVGYYLSACIA
jgi:hypothetical protein